MSFARARSALSPAVRALRSASTQATSAASAAPPPPFASSASPSSIESTAPLAASPSQSPFTPSSSSTPSPSSSSSLPVSSSSSPISTDPSPVFGRHVPLPQTHGVHVATLHLRSYTDSVQDLQFFTSFALRAARALGLPTSGAVALPIRTSLFTVPRSPFAHKKSQQNFWRKEHKRAVKVYDGNEEVVQAWFAYLRKEALPGVGMKAQVFTYREPGWGKDLVGQAEAEEQALLAAGVDGSEVGQLAKQLEQELEAGIEEAEELAKEQEQDEPVVEAAKELKEVKEKTGQDDAKDVAVKGEA
ncbi:hypothetical protein JCM8547_007491 [Rhodosporidiobolus lusitaniae]